MPLRDGKSKEAATHPDWDCFARNASRKKCKRSNGKQPKRAAAHPNPYVPLRICACLGAVFGKAIAAI